MSANPDRLYELIPVVYRLRDAEQGYPLRALLQVIAEQVTLVESDIAQLYENWFIETCQDWVVPYIGGLIGYQPVYTAGQPGVTREGQARNRIMIPRAEVANAVRYRRRKGTLSILEELATTVSGWPARVTEFYRLLAVSQNINAQRLHRGRTAELRDRDALDNLGGALNVMARNVDVRRRGRGNKDELAVFVWRLKSYTVTQTAARCYEEQAPNCFLFSPIGNDTPLYTNPAAKLGRAAPDLKLPVPIRRRAFEAREAGPASAKLVSGVPFYYGADKSFMLWTGNPAEPYPAKYIVPADLSDWSYRPRPGQVAIDPELGRIVFAPGQPGRQDVWVSYSYGFSADIGGGEYDRPISQPAGATVYRVGGMKNGKDQEDPPPDFATLEEAFAQWKSEDPTDAVIEIVDSGVYAEPVGIELRENQTLQLRAANRRRPVLQILDRQISFADSLSVRGTGKSWFILDGITVIGRGVQVEGEMSGVAIRHSTLVPGWGLECNCDPKRPTEPSVHLNNAPLCLTIEHSIVGAIQVERDEVRKDPVEIRVSDSIVDATSRERVALGASGKLCAFATLVIVRSTVIGELQAHAIALAENSILLGSVLACRRQLGCMRFCYVPLGSRTPRRYQCQPDLVEGAVTDRFLKNDITADERDSLLRDERLRVEPDFNSTRYGKPTYCQLAEGCAVEITRGADDESEMGVFHDLYQPQRAANLRARLDEYTPAGINAGVIFES